MKTFVTAFFCLLLLSCNSSSERKKDENASGRTNETSQPKKEKVSNKQALKQNGDYSNLFLWDTKNCKLLTEAEFSTAIGVPPAQVTFEDNG